MAGKLTLASLPALSPLQPLPHLSESCLAFASTFSLVEELHGPHLQVLLGLFVRVLLRLLLWLLLARLLRLLLLLVRM